MFSDGNGFWKSFQFTIKKLFGNVSMNATIDPYHAIKPTFNDITTFEWIEWMMQKLSKILIGLFETIKLLQMYLIRLIQ